ncbi:MAG: DNA translocase FtsK [Polyangiaceae bacterium]
MKLPWIATSREAPPAPNPERSPLAKAVHSFAREASAVLLIALALYAGLALASFKADPLKPEVHGANWVGPVGAAFSEILVTAVGAVAWLLPIELLVLAFPLLAPDGERTPWTPRSAALRIAGDVVVATLGAALVYVAVPSLTLFGAMPASGSVGELAGALFASLFSKVGSFIVGLTAIALILVARASFSFIEGVRAAARIFMRVASRSMGGVQAMAAAWVEARAIEARREAERVAAAPQIVGGESDAIIAALSDDASDLLADGDDLDSDTLEGAALPKESKPRVVNEASPPERAPASKARVRVAKDAPVKELAAALPIALPLPKPSADDVPTPSPLPARSRGKKAADAKVEPKLEPAKIEAKEEPKLEAPAVEPKLEAKAAPIATAALATAPSAPSATPAAMAAAAPQKPAADAPVTLKIVDTSAAREVEKVTTKVVPAVGEGFRLPMFDFLDPAEAKPAEINEEQLRSTATQLEKTLADYGVSGKVEEIHPGPTVTTFEVVPAAGTKVSKVASLADDLALGLSRKVRIIAPIPGKNRVGFEVPNAKRLPVNMRELVEDRRFAEMKAPLPCVLGRDIVGAPYFADLASMPHVIVAGATGAGKSVGLNVILVSLLYRKSPDELRLLMIDPKVVELAPYDGIPHMLLPVVTDMKQAATALKWAVDEMERRYQLFANAGTKNISTYNGYVEKVKRGEARPPKPPATPAKVAAIAADGTEVEVEAAKDGSDTQEIKPLPFIVIVVDEFADLMMQQGKDVEAAVARLAQKARAAGMHVILATQRPSVDVITGMIKANFPTRVAFRVAQKVDSRTILDEQGAEHLLGRGDMLVKMNGTNDVRRVQCPFISEEETQRVTDFLRLQGTPEYDENILKPRDDDGEGAPEEDAEDDPLYDQAVRIVAETRRCSTSWLQRKLGIGYNRAANLVETMERRGLVGPANGAKDREVLIDAI